MEACAKCSGTRKQSVQIWEDFRKKKRKEEESLFMLEMILFKNWLAKKIVEPWEGGLDEGMQMADTKNYKTLGHKEHGLFGGLQASLCC